MAPSGRYLDHWGCGPQKGLILSWSDFILKRSSNIQGANLATPLALLSYPVIVPSHTCSYSDALRHSMTLATGTITRD